ncbi:hypothetical protein ABIA24_002095 [Sinorhizobium fredii]|uniref:hypothetical protein n=1 Tax=Rhizobium fredii TaxID=380 RepID=UPI000567E55F|nr:hypothetical protein [Sinorhizobium fredii]
MSIHITERELVEKREDVILEWGGINAIRKLPWEQIARIEMFDGSPPLGSGCIIIPEDYLPPGKNRRITARTMTFSDWIPHPSPVQFEWLGRALLALWLPYRSRRNKIAASGTSLLDRMKRLRLMVKSSSESASWGGDLWALLFELQDKRYASVSCEKRGIEKMDQVIRILAEAAEDGIMPAPTRPRSKKKKRSGEQTYLRDGGETPVQTKSLPGGKFAHFSNNFVSRLMGICLWMQDNLSDQVIESTKWRRTLSAATTDKCIGKRRSL